MTRRLIRVGADALLVEVDDVETATRLYAAARECRVEATDIVPGARTVLFDGVDVEALSHQVGEWDLAAAEEGATRTVEVPTTYDGEDLDEVARLWDMTGQEVVSTHTGTEFVVAFCGFAPGFAYCTGLPEHLSVPRLESPRTHVPAGSVGLAGGFTGVYPSASPGGWQLIGSTGLGLWEITRDPPATLSPGTRVRFVEVSR